MNFRRLKMKNPIKICTGDRYGDLVILGACGVSDHGDKLYKCKCKCGNVVIKKATVLKIVESRGNINSCGCRRKIKKSLALSQH